jgi:hypothetical protein
VSRIDRWTRQVLEEQARKRGVVTPESLSSAELVREIAERSYEMRDGLRDNARKIVETLRSALPLFGRRTTSVKTLVTDTRPPAVWEARGGAVDSAAELERGSSARSGADDARVSSARAGTAERKPADARSGDASTHITLQRREAELLLSWNVGEQAERRARELLGGARGELAVRIVCVHPEPSAHVQSQISEHGPVEASGSWTVALPRADAQCVGAVGLRDGERFVSIVHETSRTPLRFDAAS